MAADAVANPPPTTSTSDPLEFTRDCSHGICSSYCPKWCIFPSTPPPPSFPFAAVATDDSGSGPTLSPLVIALIGVLAAVFLLVTYYTIIKKYCAGGGGGDGGGRGGGFRPRTLGLVGSAGGGGGGRQVAAQEAWDPALLSDGLDETLIKRITVCKYVRGGGFVDGTDCPVCLGEFHDGENLRLLPRCGHAFHIPCIDTWLRSHSNCPLCRAVVTTVTLTAEPEVFVGGGGGSSGRDEVVVVIDEVANVCEEESSEEAAPALSDHVLETKGGGGEQLPEDSRMSIADVLRASMEDEIMAARESGFLAGPGSSRRCPGKVATGAARIKNGRGKESVLPM